MVLTLTIAWSSTWSCHDEKGGTGHDLDMMKKVVLIMTFLIKGRHSLKGQCHEFFGFRFSTWISFLQAPYIPLGPFRVFSKICGDVHSSRCTTGVIDTGGIQKNLESEKFSLFLSDTFGK
jgi:hypothetical protein